MATQDHHIVTSPPPNAEWESPGLCGTHRPGHEAPGRRACRVAPVASRERVGVAALGVDSRRGVERWVLEHTRPVFDQLDPAVHPSNGNSSTVKRHNHPSGRRGDGLPTGWPYYRGAAVGAHYWPRP
jgi:hypothetical protein